MTRDRGSAATEYLSMIGLFLFVLMVCFEAYAGFSAVEKVEDAARTGARVGSMRSVAAGQSAAEAVMPAWLNDHSVRVYRDGDTVICEIDATVPVLAKGVPVDFSITRKVQIPVGG
ncbi:TadE/TadG family type IV pilus assembly protein [Spirillospora sp. CA-255316]